MLFQVLKDKIIGDVLGKTYRENRRKKRFHQLLLYAFDNSAFYQKLYSDHGIKREDLNDVDITDLPVVTKQMIVDNYDDVFIDKKIKIAEVKEWLAKEHPPCSNYLDKYIPIFTSGTTGDSAIFIYDQKAWHYIVQYNLLNVVSLKDIYTILGSKFRTASIVATHDNFAGINMFRRNRLFRNKYAIAITQPTKKILDDLHEIKPNCIICYAGILQDIYLSIKSKQIKMQPQYILSTGEYLSKKVHDNIKLIFPECKLYDSYIATESLVIAIRDDPGKDFQLFADTNIMELLGKNNIPVSAKNQGKVTITNLFNFTMPTIRYQFSEYVTSNEITAPTVAGEIMLVHCDCLDNGLTVFAQQITDFAEICWPITFADCFEHFD